MGFEKGNSPRSGKEREHETQKFQVLEQNTWRFTYEALTHVRSLRLFLFNSVIPVPWKCVSLQATLALESPISSSPLVLCEWGSSEADPHRLFVPLPVCLVDYSVPLAAFACSDHIEIKLKLLSSGGSFVDDLSLLGYTYRGEPIERGGGVKSDSYEQDQSAFSLSSDTELLTSKQGVRFYCRKCSAKLTNEPISCFRGLPSTEWRELADHWFGMCCCRDGVKTKSMMVRFEEFLTPSSGVCLVGSTTCVIHHSDVVRNILDQNQDISVNEECGTENAVEMGCKEKSDGRVPINTDIQTGVNEFKPVDNLLMTKNGFSHSGVEESVEPTTCCTGHGNGLSDDCGGEELPDHTVKTETLANGFMSAFPSSNLTPFNCYNCAGLIGVFSRGREGLQLFKCHISSDLCTGGPLDIFRFHSLERVFSNELFSNAEEDSSYRYVVRDLNSRLPLLQLVLMNQESWSCSGLCVEERRPLSEPERTSSMVTEEVSIFTARKDGGHIPPSQGKVSPVFLEPVMKVMFCDTSSFNSEQLSEVESWGQRNQSDDIYMLGSEVKALTRSLQVNRNLLPESCAAFQQFHFSFLAR